MCLLCGKLEENVCTLQCAHAMRASASCLLSASHVRVLALFVFVAQASSRAYSVHALQHADGARTTPALAFDCCTQHPARGLHTSPAPGNHACVHGSKCLRVFVLWGAGREHLQISVRARMRCAMHAMCIIFCILLK